MCFVFPYEKCIYHKYFHKFSYQANQVSWVSIFLSAGQRRYVPLYEFFVIFVLCT